MTQNQKSLSPMLIGIAAWMVLNLALMALLIINGDVEDLNNWIEIALFTIAIPAVLSGKKWGFAFTIFVLAYTLSTSVGIVIYYSAVQPSVWLNALRFLNIPIAIYLFSALFKGRIR